MTAVDKSVDPWIEDIQELWNKVMFCSVLLWLDSDWFNPDRSVLLQWHWGIWFLPLWSNLEEYGQKGHYLIMG